MTKKIVIIALAFVLCLSVIGGCFALYVEDTSELNYTFGTGDAVTLTLTPGTLTFGNVKLNPTNKTAEQKITLNATGVDVKTLNGLYGELVATINGDLAPYVTLTATTGSTTHNAATLKSGVQLPLDNLPTDFTLKIELTGDFKDATGKTATINVTWKYKEVTFTPEEGAYYIIGSFCGWEVNQKAIKMGAGTKDNLAEWTGTLPAGAEFKCVVYHKESYKGAKPGDNDWFNLQFNGDKPGIKEWGGLDYSEKDFNVIAPTPAEEIYVCVNTQNGEHYTWAQTAKSKS